MVQEEIHFPEYPYVGLTTTAYYPTFKSGKWFLVHGGASISLDEIGFLCKIPDEDLVFLKLKYGA